MRLGAHILRTVFAVFVFLTCSARAQYSGAVGYVQHIFPPGYTFCSNPLVDSNNTINIIMPMAPESSAVCLWDVASQRFSAPSVYHGGWSTNCVLSMGIGFVLYTPVSFTNYFVGGVLEGNLTNAIAGSNRLCLIASLVPQMASLTQLSCPGVDGDSVYMPDSAGRLSDACHYFKGYGWFDPTGVADTNGPIVPVCGAFFFQHKGPDTNWVRTFYVNNLTQRSTAGVKSIRAGAKTATLVVDVPSGAAYDVQFSTDRLTWATIATNQNASTFSASTSGQSAGYFRIKSSP